MRLTDYLRPECIHLSMRAMDKKQAVEELVGFLSAGERLAQPRRAVRAVMRREHTRSTGIGGGIAIPHARTLSARDLLIALGRAETPIDFQSPDGEKVDLIFLVLGPKAVTGLMIQALARITCLVASERTREHMRNASTPSQLHAVIARLDRRQETAEAE
jgi:mannitol/fructose-specific phosphotransferase system IIA component (Ntr-type)